MAFVLGTYYLRVSFVGLYRRCLILCPVASRRRARSSSPSEPKPRFALFRASDTIFLARRPRRQMHAWRFYSPFLPTNSLLLPRHNTKPLRSSRTQTAQNKTLETTNNRSCWSLSYTLEAGRFVLSGLWKALRPPPGLFGIVRRAQQGIASCCCGWTRPTPVLQRDEARRSVDGEGGGGRGIGRQRRKGWRDKVPGSQAFWCFKVEHNGRHMYRAVMRHSCFSCFENAGDVHNTYA